MGRTYLRSGYLKSPPTWKEILSNCNKKQRQSDKELERKQKGRKKEETETN